MVQLPLPTKAPRAALALRTTFPRTRRVVALAPAPVLVPVGVSSWADFSAEEVLAVLVEELVLLALLAFSAAVVPRLWAPLRLVSLPLLARVPQAGCPLAQMMAQSP